MTRKQNKQIKMTESVDNKQIDNDREQLKQQKTVTGSSQNKQIKTMTKQSEQANEDNDKAVRTSK